MEGDTAAAIPVVVINDALAQRYFHGEPPIGQSLRTMPSDPWRTIVGVVQDVKNAGLTAAPEPTIYFPYRQTGGLSDQEWILIRTPLNPTALESELRKSVAQLDPQQPVGEIQTLEHRLNESASRPRMAAVLLRCFAALGLVLAAVGLYGVMSCFVRWRFNEIGIRPGNRGTTARYREDDSGSRVQSHFRGYWGRNLLRAVLKPTDPEPFVRSLVCRSSHVQFDCRISCLGRVYGLLYPRTPSL